MAYIAVRLFLPEALAIELQQAASEREMRPTDFIEDLVHVNLASRRLPGVKHGPTGPRLSGSEPSAIRAGDDADVDAGPLDAVEIPSLEDVSALEDIT